MDASQPNNYRYPASRVQKLATSALDKLGQYAREGLPAVYKESVQDWLYDFWPDLPWNMQDAVWCVNLMREDPRYPTIIAEFKTRYGFDMDAELSKAGKEE